MDCNQTWSSERGSIRPRLFCLCGPLCWEFGCESHRGGEFPMAADKCVQTSVVARVCWIRPLWMSIHVRGLYRGARSNSS